VTKLTQPATAYCRISIDKLHTFADENSFKIDDSTMVFYNNLISMCGD